MSKSSLSLVLTLAAALVAGPPALAGASPAPPDKVSVTKADPVGDGTFYPDRAAFTARQHESTDVTKVLLVADRTNRTFTTTFTLRDLHTNAGDRQFFDIDVLPEGADYDERVNLSFYRRGGQVRVFDLATKEFSQCRSADVSRLWKKDQMRVEVPLSCVGNPHAASFTFYSTINNDSGDQFDPDILTDRVRATRVLHLTAPQD